MAKKDTKKTQSKELKPEIQDKKEVAKPFPKSETVKIILLKDGKTYSVGNQLGRELVEMKRAKLV